MVVTTTVSGVLLSAVQLVAAYKLASAASSKDMGSQGGSVDLEVGKISVKSSVTGLLILAVSFAFFIVFVNSVYSLKNRFLDPAIPAADGAEKELTSSSGLSSTGAVNPQDVSNARRLAPGGLGPSPPMMDKALAPGGLGLPPPATKEKIAGQVRTQREVGNTPRANTVDKQTTCLNGPNRNHP
ncbi:hypothetical protein LMG24238_07244 [Paraburkholderia sediminicola]|uniref:Uncharacterized protein n=1 Tax=Paraburkholderia sediminicola TaxID=458836 RepID=A0A6J5CSB4_9BURK|nr:hypothetical protein [Paraburkholderia sediminicola]CAB3744350.1 hypothetical protein LMG24238_07244 [Paraburkholderia sediminicola]